ncbi:transcriptional regulator [Acinetobacter baumannii]|uniref:transcriptional regulator n=1 Tax=Acinetobacter baumannii TaxID=470 RepID=UPI000DE70357|nr:transcriptional regulator [Acinetobacter baumannii]EJB0086805.1 transcriptional regulator [Acinetobacter baumannii]EKT7970150.1 transcriptional regulator [Acinetobacter baumannii]EKT8392334.1 transcriptional regulator [Acinetobacter baumannii]EKT8489785.1 transcriptional regulator [Acinetobacter baumannii]EKT8582620.1 transcriptional regulator [Acinetobacter baumannii]
MTLKEKILFLTVTRGYTQQEVSIETGIEQSSVSRILKNTQKSVGYQKGIALDAFVNREKEKMQTQTA